MLVQSILSSYSRQLVGALLALSAVSLDRLQRKGGRKSRAPAPGPGRHRALRGRDARAQFCRHHPAPDRDRHGLSGTRQGREAPGRSRPDRRCRPAACDPR